MRVFQRKIEKLAKVGRKSLIKDGIHRMLTFVFDWDLNPIKKFDFPDRKYGYYRLSNDGCAVYFSEYTEDGLILHKANLNI